MLPALRADVRGGAERRGGIVGYPLKALHEEVAFVAYYFHWPRQEVLNLEHAERRRWVEEISSLHQRMNDEAGGGGMVNLGMP